MWPSLSQSVISEIHKLGRSSFFSKRLKFDLDFKNAESNWQKVFCFLYNCIWIGSGKFHLLRRKYLLSAVSVLTKSPKISISIRETFFKWIFFSLISKYDKVAAMLISTVSEIVYQVEGSKSCCRADLNSVWEHLPCSFSKDLLKQDFLDVCLTTSFVVRNFGNTEAMRVIFFLKMFKIWY